MQSARGNAAFLPALTACLALASGLILSACKSRPEKGSVLAQVGNSTLTLDELRESFPAEFERLIKREQYLDFVNRWIDDEVVFQQALKGRLEEDPRVRRKLEKLRRKLLIEEFLARENASEVFEPDEMAMNQYYEMHKDEFRRPVPEIKYASIRVSDEKQAKDVKNKLSGDNFLELAAKYSLDPPPGSDASIAFRKESDVPPCLAAEAAAAPVGAVTRPIACPDGVYLIKVLEKEAAGGIIPFSEAGEQIGNTLLMERKDKLMEEKIAKYKEGVAINYNLDQIPGVEETSKSVETGSSAPVSPASPESSTAKPSFETPAQTKSAPSTKAKPDSN